MEQPEKQLLAPTYMPPAVRIRRGVIGEITIHQITEEELVILANGYPDSIYLNYSIFLISTAFSLLTALLTATVTNKVFNVFTFIIILGFILGGLSFILWFRTRKSTSDLVKSIRGRLPPPEGIQEIPIENGK